MDVYMVNGVPHIEGPYGLERLYDYEYKEMLESYTPLNIVEEYCYD